MSQELSAVWIVQTFLTNPGRWFAWSAHLRRSGSWDELRRCREKWPQAKFRSVRFTVMR